MLTAERNRRYFVYPSWAHFRHPWEDLPRLMSDPVGQGWLEESDYSVRQMREVGYRMEPVEVRSISGTAPGGLLIAEIPCQELFLGRLLFSLDPMGSCPVDELSRLNAQLSKLYPFCVSYLEPRSEPYSGIRVPLYLCWCTPEHVESDKDHLYWVFEYKDPSRKAPKQLDEMSEIAAPFCNSVRRLEGVPPTIAEEVAPLFPSPDWGQVWFEVEPKEWGAGYNYAVNLYLSFQMRKMAGSRLRAAHLFAHIEGAPPSHRATWSLR